MHLSLSIHLYPSNDPSIYPSLSPLALYPSISISTSISISISISTSTSISISMLGDKEIALAISIYSYIDRSICNTISFSISFSILYLSLFLSPSEVGSHSLLHLCTELQVPDEEVSLSRCCRIQVLMPVVAATSAAAAAAAQCPRYRRSCLCPA